MLASRNSKVFRSWWAMRLQKRRRASVAAPVVPPLPDVLLGDGSFESESTWFNTSFAIAVDLKTWPAANLEIWVNNNFTGYALLDTIASGTDVYVHNHAAVEEASLIYKARYTDGTNLGLFSNELQIDVTL